jgi:PII-like signaling protein
MMIIAVGSGERIGRVLPELGGLLRRPMVTLERVRLCKQAGELVERPHELPGTDDQGRPLFQKLMVYTSERAIHDGNPVHRAIVRTLRATGARGATAIRGIWGFHGDRPPHGATYSSSGAASPS